MQPSDIAQRLSEAQKRALTYWPTRAYGRMDTMNVLFRLGLVDERPASGFFITKRTPLGEAVRASLMENPNG